MSRRLQLAAKARQDVRVILARSSSAFGADQAKAYNAKIKKTLASLREIRVPLTIRMRDDLAPGLRLCRIAGGGTRHLVFFRIENDVVEVVRILHEAMDFSRHIDDPGTE